MTSAVPSRARPLASIRAYVLDPTVLASVVAAPPLLLQFAMRFDIPPQFEPLMQLFGGTQLLELSNMQILLAQVVVTVALFGAARLAARGSGASRSDLTAYATVAAASLAWLGCVLWWSTDLSRPQSWFGTATPTLIGIVAFGGLGMTIAHLPGRARTVAAVGVGSVCMLAAGFPPAPPGTPTMSMSELPPGMDVTGADFDMPVLFRLLAHISEYERVARHLPVRWLQQGVGNGWHGDFDGGSTARLAAFGALMVLTAVAAARSDRSHRGLVQRPAHSKPDTHMAVRPR